MADSASRLGLAYTHGKRREEKRGGEEKRRGNIAMN